jgi:hypothetical protein
MGTAATFELMLTGHGNDDNEELYEAATAVTTDELQTRIADLENRIEEMESGSNARICGHLRPVCVWACV